MKKIFLLLTVFSMVFTSCDPLEDINTEIDTETSAIVGEAEITLSEDDYSSLELKESYFNTREDAKAMIPSFLKDLYPVWGESSSILVNYELKSGTDLEEVVPFTEATSYNFSNEDYATTGSDAFGFYPDVNPTKLIPSILDTKITSPTEGQIVLAKYKQYVETPVVGLANVVEYNFAGSFQEWAIKDIEGDQGWSSETDYIQGNGYDGGQQANEDWLVSPEIDLTGQGSLKFQINQAIKYADDLSLLKILVSTNWDGATYDDTQWDLISLDSAPNGDFVLSEDYDFSAYDDQKIHIAFKYKSTDSDAGRWRIKNLYIKIPGATGDTNSKGEYFIYKDGNWKETKKTYYLSSDDYDSMGESSGQPGKYDNFDGSNTPNQYIPSLLSTKYPFAQEEENMYVYAKYYNGSETIVRGNNFTFTNGSWMPHKTKLQFGYQDGKWVPDNTIKYTLVRNADYEYMASQLTDAEYADLIENLAGYGDFDYNWSEEQIQFALALFLDHLDPNAAEGQKYILTYVIYDNGEGDYQTSFIKTDGAWVVNE